MTIDILLPYWGPPAYLYEAVDSVRAQTEQDWRLVVVDDCYPDPAVAQWFAALDDPRVEYHRNETNQGITENYRRCLAHARADWVVFLGCDDVMHPNYLAVVGDAVAAHPEVAVVQPGVRVIDADGRPVRPLVDRVKQEVVRPRAHGATVLRGERLAANLLTGDWLYWPSLLISRRSLEIGFREGFPMIQDLAIVMDIVFDGGALLYVPTECFSYRRHRSSASASGAFDGSRFVDEARYFEVAADRAAALGWRRAEAAARARLTSRAHALTLLPGIAASRNWPAARVLARHALGR
ncbi:glycosyltransferase [Cellulomonas sp. zg-ZUI199]|uniref:Glycosyltransferase n=1 Tax=Cellulomonas wangleii TaxID=2816956 RepID=A0ABX8D144_9CELL|nr:glycosyltransferase [Cellulomonas wangleii]MBO0925296.1 glycosyltransferase [Cellulomonas wangleii]QVI61205.1 glycosyltransferase [Cellulomonas wangleii]